MKNILKKREWDFYKDQLTGYQNRFALLEFLGVHTSRTTIYVINIDNFSNLNRMYGFILGDELLKHIANYLNTLKLSHMQFFRFDGDEFVYLTTEFMNFKEIEEFSKAVISFFNQVDIEIEHATQENSIKAKVSVSVGVAMGNGIITLNHAQIAINEARLNAKGSYKLFTAKSEYSQKQQENVYWINKIKNAIEEENLIAFYQPIKNLHSDKIEKYECLARINDEALVVSPVRFMEAAKVTGTLSLITRSIIKKAFKEFSKTDLEFSINITANDIKLGYLEEFLMLHVKKYDINPSRVVLELLEDIVTLTEGNMLQQIESLRREGFKVAVDDFGMENSNFSRLLELQPDYLKIDGAFIKNITEDKKSQIIVEAIVEICQKSQIKVIAEFVSNKDILNYLKKIGVDYAQGFYIGKPLEHIRN